MKNQFINNIKQKKETIVIWGCGLLGTTNLVYVAKSGYNCLGIECNTTRIHQINNLDYRLASDETVLGQYKSEDIQNHIEATDKWEIIVEKRLCVHIICVPTEKNGKPYIEPFLDVINKIAKINISVPILIIVESTITPAWFDKAQEIMRNNGRIMNENIFWGAAPRRDLFGEKTFSLKYTNRVIGGSCDLAIDIIKDFYSNYCDNLIIAKDCKHAMLSKIVENMFRFCNIFLANQLMTSLPDYDVSHVLKLGGTKWNMEEYHPSLGIGGYCIPLAMKYYLDEINMTNNTESSLFIKISKENDIYTNSIMNRLKQVLKDYKSVAVLGISYIPNIKVTNGTIAIEIIDALLTQDKVVGIHDPYMTRKELQSLNRRCEVISFPEGLKEYDVVFAVTGHDVYKDFSTMSKFLKEGCVIIDNLGFWTNNNTSKYKYYEVGSNKFD